MLYNSDIRILRIIDLLVFHKIVKDSAEFCDAISMHRQSLTKIKNGKGHFTQESIEKMAKVYRINPNCVFGIEKNVFYQDQSIEIPDDVKILIANKTTNKKQ